MKLQRRNLLKTLGLSALTLSNSSISFAEKKQPNVLFIAVDDLRPELGCFGNTQILSPNIDKLAAGGTIFTNCFCQVPVCGASRASLLTGVRPTRDRFLNYSTWADKDLPGNLSLPRYFKENGYHTISNGKIYHHKTDGKGSWSEEAWRPKSPNWRDYHKPENIEITINHEDHRGPAYECIDVPDNTYQDGKIAEKTIQDLRRMKEQGKPFFIATGFLKPHLPFNAPKKYWDLYDRDEIEMPENIYPPKDAPKSAMHNWGELRNYHGIPKKGPLNDDFARTLKHGYYACVSYTDAQIGRVMDELEQLGLKDNTIVVLWGDHGWNLREHGLWCKHCNFHTSLRAPLIISAPGFKPGQTCNELSEFVDIYPTLCDLCGLKLPDHLEGISAVPLLIDPKRNWKKAIFSRWIKGDSVKTKRYVYTEWRDDKGNRYSTMLYDHKVDPDENVNISLDEKNQGLVARMSRLIKDGWKKALPDDME
jgi:iduronate 2-sulfatase